MREFIIVLLSSLAAPPADGIEDSYAWVLAFATQMSMPKRKIDVLDAS
jgi:hypothetical protein